MTAIPEYGGRRGSFGPGVSQFMPLANTGAVPTATESAHQRTVRAAGTYSHFYVRIFSNNVGASTMGVRKNGANGNQSVSIGASSTGVFEDTTNSDAVVAADLINVFMTTGAGGTQFRPWVMGCRFAATTNTVQAYGQFGLSASTASTTVVGKYSSDAITGAAETASAQLRMKVAGTLKWLNVVVSANARTTATTIGNRLNSAAGAMSVSVGATSTGQFEDTTHSDTIVANDLIDPYITCGTGAGTITAAIYVHLESTGQETQLNTAFTNLVLNQAATAYLPPSGISTSTTTEVDVQTKLGIASTISNLQAYVSANTISAASTLRTRKNAANGAQSISIGASSTGWFEDSTNSDSISTTDELDYQFVGGAGGTSLTLQFVGAKLAVAGGGTTVTPGVSAVDVTGFAPTLSLPVTVSVGKGQVDVTGFAPTISLPVTVSPGKGDVAVSGFAPGILLPVTVLPGTGAVAASGFAPTIATPVTITPGVGQAVFAGFAPTIAMATTVLPGRGQAVFTGFAPVVSVVPDVLPPPPPVTPVPLKSGLMKEYKPGKLKDLADALRVIDELSKKHNELLRKVNEHTEDLTP